jgi:hypothetical protein
LIVSRARGLAAPAIALFAFGACASGAAAACRWVAPPFARVRDNTHVPNFHAHPDFGADAVPPVLPTPAPAVWNPVFPIDRGGRIHGRSDGAISSVVTISGGGCTVAHVAVLIYGDGFVPQRSLALNYGASDTRDELNAGKGDFTTVTVHGEAEAPLRLRDVWISADFRSVGYKHAAGPVNDVGGLSQTFRPAFGVRDDSLEVRSGYALQRFGPTIELAYLNAATNAYRPDVSGVGLAVEVPPALDETLSAFGSVAYYPSLSGSGIEYGGVRYRLGTVLSLFPAIGHPYFFELSFLGDRRWNRHNAPAGADYSSAMLGFGYRFGGIR